MLHVKPNPKKLTALVYLLIIYAAHKLITDSPSASWRGVESEPFFSKEMTSFNCSLKMLVALVAMAVKPNKLNH